VVIERSEGPEPEEELLALSKAFKQAASMNQNRWSPLALGQALAPLRCRRRISSQSFELRNGSGYRRATMSAFSNVMPNPSIEGTFKRLRLLPAPHVKR
jgi:hypothetical protein